jgi:hypothetical protein
MRPPGIADQRYDRGYLFATCRPGTDEAMARALPRATTAAMAVFLAAFAQQLAPDVHAVLLLDRAGWHPTPKLVVPDTITLLPLPPCSPELNPVERVWLHLRERFRSHRVLKDYAAILDAACTAWNRRLDEPGPPARLPGYSYIMQFALAFTQLTYPKGMVSSAVRGDSRGRFETLASLPA